jgi:hypothetical protein
MCVQRSSRKVIGLMLALAFLGGCEGRWAVDWGGPCYQGGYDSCGHIECGGGEGGLIVLGALAIAWGIQEIIAAASRCR